ncbi:MULTISPECIES: TetR family transcriptional regulator [Micrococcaceae]|uniref:Transcriptional regulator, TetR family n=1 Tax=Arthrobacter rhombi TaxID=71253 RepID=A0A1R4GU82_9MICC|nr:MULTISPECIES: TetR family transcriptional regulator [Micrococcaceae]SJM71806.1 Transcriptional regulator, TetR family [Arthrobacter rhombi]
MTPLPESSTSGPSRREINKTATRAAIVDAAMTLLRAEGFEAVTADRVADAAGVSRRTFFNYFPSLEAALNGPTEAFVEHVIQLFEAQPRELPIMSAAVNALNGMADRSLLAPVAELVTVSHSSPQLDRLELESWNDCAERLVAMIVTRVPSTDPLTASVFANSIIGAGRAAVDFWIEQAGGDLSEASITILQQHLTTALSQLRDGFPTLNVPATPAQIREA